jgi:hypothetical protein
MAAAKNAGTKKGQDGQRFRVLNGQKVTPVLYNGRAIGHGKYLSGSVAGQLVTDEAGVPIRWKQIGTLELA